MSQQAGGSADIVWQAAKIGAAVAETENASGSYGFVAPPAPAMSLHDN